MPPALPAPAPAAPLTLTVPGELVQQCIRERVDALLNSHAIAEARREMALLAACVTSEEAGLLLGLSPRGFRELAERIGIPLEPLGYKTPRYRLAHLIARLDELAVAAGAEKTLLTSRLAATAGEILRRLACLAVTPPASADRLAA